jgi:aspartyl-tRNA(Asn)/glutamyl-tRNA(Gln) amidotransferase subunit C
MADRETVRKVAELARLELSDGELERFSKDMEEITKAFSVLRKVDTKGVEPTFQPVERKNVLRDDEVEESIPRETLLKNLKNKEKGFIKGPKVV